MASCLAGQGCGFDIDLVKMVSDAVTIPVIASSGAGAVEHFSEVFEKTNASAALAAGIFHRKEVWDPTFSSLLECYAITYERFLSVTCTYFYLLLENDLLC